MRSNLNCQAAHPLVLALSISGGGERDRTDDPLLAKQVLSQLSYTPKTVPRPAGIAPAVTADIAGGSGWIRTNDPRLIKTVL